MASKLSGKERRKKALLRPKQGTEMGVQVCDVQLLVSFEGDTVRPHKPLWAVEEPERSERLRRETILRSRGAKGAVQGVPPAGDQRGEGCS